MAVPSEAVLGAFRGSGAASSSGTRCTIPATIRLSSALAVLSASNCSERTRVVSSFEDISEAEFAGISLNVSSICCDVPICCDIYRPGCRRCTEIYRQHVSSCEPGAAHKPYRLPSRYRVCRVIIGCVRPLGLSPGPSPLPGRSTASKAQGGASVGNACIFIRKHKMLCTPGMHIGG